MVSFNRETSSETYGPRSIFHLLFSDLQNQKYENTSLSFIYFYLFYIYLSDLTLVRDHEGIDNPFFALCASVSLCRWIDWRLACASYWIDTLVLN